jgi:hypothetical protein
MTEQDIFDKYPKIFRDKDLPMTDTCMCWGLDTPSSWFPIIDELCNAIETSGYIVFSKNQDGSISFPQVIADQVKEKWNGLRFYYHLEYDKKYDGIEIEESICSRHSSYIDGMIAYAEARVASL